MQDLVGPFSVAHDAGDQMRGFSNGAQSGKGCDPEVFKELEKIGV